MKQSRLRIGSVIVLFTVIMICAAIFSVLTIVTASSDYKVSTQYGAKVQDLYQCENLGQEWLRQIDSYRNGDVLPENTEVDGDFYSTRIETDSMELKITVEVAPNEYRILEWRCTPAWETDTDLNLWQ